MSRYSPWGDLTEREHISVAHVALDGTIDGYTRPPAGAEDLTRAEEIALERHLTQVERRCALAHELAHIDLGHRCWLKGDSPDAGRLSERDEIAAWALAARRLITIELLDRAIALYGETNLGAIADELNVTPQVLEARREGLHPAERAMLKRLAAAREEAP